MIGLRYLYGGRRDVTSPADQTNPGARRALVMFLIASLLMIGAGRVLDLIWEGPWGSLLQIIGMVGAGLFVLLLVFSVFTAVSVLGVAFGVGALTVVLAVTTGFQKQFRDKVLGVNAHVIVLKSQATFAEYRDVMKTAKEIDPDVLAVQPFIFAEMLVTRGKGELSGVAIKGIDPKLVRGVLDLDKHMTEGNVDSLLIEACPSHEGVKAHPRFDPQSPPKCLDNPPIIMGKELAHKLKAKVGD